MKGSACGSQPARQRLASAVGVLALRIGRLRLAKRRVRELSDSRTSQARLWICLLLGLLEFYVEAARSDRLHHVRVGIGSRARDLYLRANGVDIYTFYATFIKGIYDAVLPLPPGSVIVDLGGNIGITAAYWLTVCDDPRIVVVEPESSNVDLMRKNLEPSEASIHEAAIAERSGNQLLEIHGATGHTLITGQGELTRDVQAVETITLDDLCTMEHLGHVDLIKADIEGAELAVFTRPWQILANCDRIIMEVHEVERRSELVDFLTELGFRHQPGERVDFPDVFCRSMAGEETVVQTATGALDQI
jgi:FkbM family methyltransferase